MSIRITDRDNPSRKSTQPTVTNKPLNSREILPSALQHNPSGTIDEQ